MAEIVVTPKTLEDYGKDLETKATEFSNLLGSMEEAVTSISSSWEGEDSETFITKATAYVHNLKAIENALLEYGNIVKNCSVAYSNMIVDFYSFLG